MPDAKLSLWAAFRVNLAVTSFCVTLALGLDSLLYCTSQILLAYSVCLSPIRLVIKVNPVFGEALYINPKSVCVFGGGRVFIHLSI